MKRFSIKKKVTLWYTGMIAVVLAAVFAGVFVFINQLELSKTEEDLQGAVADFTDEFEFQNGTYYLNPDVDYYDDGVMFSIYDQDGRLLHGSMPVEFPKNLKLQSHEVRNIKQGGKQWMIYDAAYQYGTGKAIWIRGIVSIHGMEQIMRMVMLAFAAVYPLLILMIGWIGYMMTKRALKPVDDICTTAEEISSGADLSKRLSVPRTKDEMHQLTCTFNEMFDRLEASFEDEKQFTSDVSHELRTPVSVIIAECEYALEEDGVSEEQKQEVRIVLRQAKKMSELISQLLMIARCERGKEDFQFEAVDMSMLAEMTLEELSGKAEEKKIHLLSEIEPGLMAAGDQMLLTRMLINLVENSINYGKRNGIVKVSLFRDNGKIRGIVKDDGQGIGAEHLDKIWNRFYRADRSRNSQNPERGTGLGLSMVRWIVRIHEGQIWVKSKEGEGSEFIFELKEM